MGLTWNVRFRKGLRRRAVLQVEEEVKPFWSKSGELKPRWRDATLTDLAEAELRTLIDLGRRPMFRFGSGIRLPTSAQASSEAATGEPWERAGPHLVHPRAARLARPE